MWWGRLLIHMQTSQLSTGLGLSGCREQGSCEDKRKEVKSFPAEGLPRGAPPVTRGQLSRTTPQLLNTSTPTSQISPKPLMDIILG